jgi:hypothetical protein
MQFPIPIQVFLVSLICYAFSLVLYVSAAFVGLFHTGFDISSLHFTYDLSGKELRWDAKWLLLTE